MSNSDTSKTAKLKSFLRKHRSYQGVLFILPALILLCVFCLYPTVMAFVNSFTNWDGGLKADFVWLDNYKNVFADELFWRSLLNAVILTVVKERSPKQFIGKYIFVIIKPNEIRL